MQYYTKKFYKCKRCEDTGLTQTLRKRDNAIVVFRCNCQFGDERESKRLMNQTNTKGVKIVEIIRWNEKMRMEFIPVAEL